MTIPLSGNILINALRKKYPPDRFASITEVGDGVHNRRADALVVGLWRSHGFVIEGFEFKSSRTDWLNEMKQPEKSEPIFRFCDHWWLVTTDPTVAKKEELPPTWGYLTLTKFKEEYRLRVVVPAPKLESTVSGPGRSFLAMVTGRLVSQATPQALLDQMRHEGYEEGHKDGKEAGLVTAKHAFEDLKTHQDILENFRKKTGLELSTWNPDRCEEIGEAVRQVIKGEHMKVREQLTHFLNSMARITKEVEDALSTFPCESSPAPVPGGATS